MNDPFDIPLERLRKRTSAKWTSISSSDLPLWVAEMDVELAEPIKARLHEAVDLSDTGYSGDSTGYREAFAGFARRRWGWRPDPDLAVCFPDLAEAGAVVLRHFARGDKRVLICTPIYNSFWLWFEEAGVTPVQVPLADAAGTPDFDAIERALADGVRTVLISNPHNPLGRLWTRDELTRLADLAVRYGAKVVSDEIHAPLTYSGGTFVPFLDVGEAARSCGVAFHSASKAWNLAGLKASLVVRDATGPTYDIPTEMPWNMGIFGLLAGEVAFRDSVEWLDEVVSQLAARAAHVRDRLAAEMPAAQVVMPQASYLMWVDLRQVFRGDDTPGETIHERTGLFVSDGPNFGRDGRGHVRLNIATSRAILDEALDRLVRAVG